MRLTLYVPVIFSLFIVVMSVSTICYANETGELIRQRVTAIKTFDIGGINFTMTKSEIIKKLIAEGYAHEPLPYNKHRFKKGVSAPGKTSTVIGIEFRYPTADSLPQRITFNYRPDFNLGEVPNWDNKPYWEVTKTYFNALCNGLTRAQQEDVRVWCGPIYPQDARIKVPPQTTGSDGQKYIFELKRGGMKHWVRADIYESPEQRKSLTADGWRVINPPYTVDGIVADLELFSQQCAEMAPKVKHLRGAYKRATNCIQSCKNNIQRILNNGLNVELNQNLWRECFLFSDGLKKSMREQ